MVEPDRWVIDRSSGTMDHISPSERTSYYLPEGETISLPGEALHFMISNLRGRLPGSVSTEQGLTGYPDLVLLHAAQPHTLQTGGVKNSNQGQSITFPPKIDKTLPKTGAIKIVPK